mgnify:CR=1 FL=1
MIAASILAIRLADQLKPRLMHKRGGLQRGARPFIAQMDLREPVQLGINDGRQLLFGGVVAILPPLPPGCMQTVWRDDERFVRTYFSSIPGKLAYSTFDWGIRDQDGYYFILGRTDDVINVAGHRLGTREIEESLSSHSSLAECAVVGVADSLKGQVAVGFAVVRDPASIAELDARMKLEGELMATVDRQLGAVARPARVHFVSALPKTRSGKVLQIGRAHV